MIKTILFDLDGTLLDMDQEAFLRAYFKKIAGYFAARGYDPARFSEAMFKSVHVMLNNDGRQTNEEIFWNTFPTLYGDERMRDDIPAFEVFYQTAFGELESLCKEKAGAAEALKRLREMGFSIVLASNPVFPYVAYERRMKWGGLMPEMFDWLTTYENVHYCKPTEGYYAEIADRMGVKPEECLMVGNDVSDDMPARKIGMQVFLMDDTLLLNPKNEDLSIYPRGDFDALVRYIEENR